MCFCHNHKLLLIMSISMKVLSGTLTIIKICFQEGKNTERNWKEEVHYICFRDWIPEEPKLRNCEWNLRLLRELPELVDLRLLFYCCCCCCCCCWVWHICQTSPSKHCLRDKLGVWININILLYIIDKQEGPTV